MSPGACGSCASGGQRVKRSDRTTRRKRTMAWAMLAFVVVTAVPAHLWWAKGEPFWILVLSELALAYTAIVGILVEEDA